MLFFLFLIGVSIGSFLNVLIDRLSHAESIMGRSYCDHCHKRIKWYDLIPIISFFLLRAKSRCCRKKISVVYPLVEFLTGTIFVLSWIYLPFPVWPKVVFLGVFSMLIVVFFADFKYQVIPDEIQVMLFLFSAVYLFLQGLTIKNYLQHFAASFVVMAVILSLFLLTRGHGMGFGDVKLAFSMGLLLGTKAGLAALYVAFIAGALIGLILILARRKKLRSKIAFGPFLVLGTVVMVFFQDKFFDLVKTFYGF